MRPLLIAVAILTTLAAQPPSARKITAVRVFGNDGQTGLFVATSDGSEIPLLSPADTDYDPVWAPDGSSIVFTSERDGSAELYRVKPDGSGLERLTNDPAYDDQAAFSPNGKQLVFVTTRNGGHAVLWTMDLATHRARPLTSGPGGDYEHVGFPDGKWIAFSSSRGNGFPFSHGRWERLQLADIHVIRPDNSGLKKIGKKRRLLRQSEMDKRQPSPCGLLHDCRADIGESQAEPRTRKRHATRLDRRHHGHFYRSPRRPGRKINPSALPGNDVGYIRKDNGEPGSGIYYTSGKRGPRGDVRTASWSPDGKYVVFHRAGVPRAVAGDPEDI